MTGSVFDQLREYISEGEIRHALVELRSFLAGQVQLDGGGSRFRGYYNETILHLSRISRTDKAERRGTLDHASGDRSRAELTSAVLDLIDEIALASARSKLPVPERPVRLPSNQNIVLEKIWGKNTLKSLSWLHEGIKRAASVCRVVSPRSLGSGFVLGNCVLVTNNHVLASAAEAVEASVEFNFQEDENGNISPITKYRLDPSHFVTNTELDCTAIKIAPGDTPIPPSTWGSLTCNAKQIELGDHVTIIQHPRGGPKQIGLTANEVVNIFGSRLQYMTDTLPGSSGSPVFNDDWQVIAIHHAGGNLIKSNAGDRIFANEGILMSEILSLPEFATLVLDRGV